MSDVRAVASEGELVPSGATDVRDIAIGGYWWTAGGGGVDHALQGCVYGIGIGIGRLAANRALQGEAVGIGSEVGAIGVNRALQAEAVGVGSEAARLGRNAGLAASMVGIGTQEGILRATRGLAARLVGMGVGQAALGVERWLAGTSLGIGISAGRLRLGDEVVEWVFPQQYLSLPKFQVLASSIPGDWRYPTRGTSNMLFPLNCVCEWQGRVYVGASKFDTWQTNQLDHTSLEATGPVRRAWDEFEHSGTAPSSSFYREYAPDIIRNRPGSALLIAADDGELRPEGSLPNTVAAVFQLRVRSSGLLAGVVDVDEAGEWSFAVWRCTEDDGWVRVGGVQFTDWEDGQTWARGMLGVSGVEEYAGSVYMTIFSGVYRLDAGGAVQVWNPSPIEDSYADGLLRWRSGLLSKQMTRAEPVIACTLGFSRHLFPNEWWGRTESRYQCPNQYAVLDGQLYGLYDGRGGMYEPPHYIERGSWVVEVGMVPTTTVGVTEAGIEPLIGYNRHIRGLFRWCGLLYIFGLQHPEAVTGEQTLGGTLDLFVRPNVYSQVVTLPGVLWSVYVQEDLGRGYAIAVSPPVYEWTIDQALQEHWTLQSGLPTFYVLRFAAELESYSVSYEWGMKDTRFTPDIEGVIYEFAKSHVPVVGGASYEYAVQAPNIPDTGGVVYEFADGSKLHVPTSEAVALEFSEGGLTSPDVAEIELEWALRERLLPNVQVVELEFSNGLGAKPQTAEVALEFATNEFNRPETSIVVLEFSDGTGASPESADTSYEWALRPNLTPDVRQVRLEFSGGGGASPWMRRLIYEWAWNPGLQEGESWISVIEPLADVTDRVVRSVCVVVDLPIDQWPTCRAFIRVDHPEDVAWGNGVSEESVTDWASYDQMCPIGVSVPLHKAGQVVRVTIIKQATAAAAPIGVVLSRLDEPEE